MSRHYTNAWWIMLGSLTACADNGEPCKDGKTRNNGSCVATVPSEAGAMSADAAARDGGATPQDGRDASFVKPDAQQPAPMDGGDDPLVSGDAAQGMDAWVAEPDAAQTPDAAQQPDAARADGGRDAGALSCTPVCNPALDGACIVPAELTCDGVDDNCNGQIDEGLSGAFGPGTAWKMPITDADAGVPGSMADDQRGLAALLPRAAGGAYLLYKAVASLDASNPITVARLNGQGDVIGQEQTGVLPDSRFFLADSFGKYVAFVYFVSDRDGVVAEAEGETRLALYQENASGLLEELADEAIYPANSDMAAISLNVDQNEQLRVLLAYADARDNGNNSTGTGAPMIHLFRYDPDAVAKLEQVAAPVVIEREQSMPGIGDAGPSVSITASSTTVRIARKPCQPGWLITHQDPPSGVGLSTDRQLFLRAVSSDGDVDMNGAALWSGDKGFSSGGLEIDARCDQATSRVLTVLGNSSTLYGHELIWDNTSGSVSETKSPLEVGAAPRFAKILPHQGTWLVSTWTRGVSPVLFKLDFESGISTQATLPVDHAILSWLDVRDVHMYYAPVLGLVELDASVLVSFVNGSPPASPLGRDTIAVTYTLGCDAP